MDEKPYENTVRRAALPEVLFADDVSAALGVPEQESSRLIADGRLGPSFLVGGRPAVLRETVLAHLSREARIPASREILPRRSPGRTTPGNSAGHQSSGSRSETGGRS